ncbi:MAG: alpha/beta hydrolase [Candidatus Lambdaproteobacteria bacterium]|nr:alpha/beta hydrolase [Candidatus Lambdaproteobacteria bacterium]
MPSAEYLKLEEKVWANRPRGEQSLEERRAFMAKTGAMFRLADDVTCTRVDVNGVPGEWIATPGVATDKVLLYLHGGGYVMGAIDTHREMISRLVRAGGLRALAIDYRLAPEHPFPAGLDDAVTAYRWLLGQGLAPGRIAVGGDSAGGGLALGLLLALKQAGEPQPGAAVLLSPWADLTVSGSTVATKAKLDCMVDAAALDMFSRMYIGNEDPRNPLASPLFGDPAGLPPLLFQVGTHEILLDDALRMAERARAAGVEVTLERGEGLMHVWQWFAPMIPEGREAIERIGAFLKGRIA